MKIHEIYLKRCLALAELGKATVSPNPMVGSVIVYEGKIIGEGYHHAYGQPHAEVNAIASVKNKEWLKKATIYVSLEPCSHHGKTPPCADLIISYGIPRVVVGVLDPNPMVSGKGVERLKQQGCEVVVGVLEEECRALNKRFFTYHQKKRPYVILKWAETQDGFMDIDRIALPSEDTAHQYWITNDELKVLVHKWRSEEDAILVGTKTAKHDNPSLTTREWVGKNPIRIVLDRHLTLPSSLHVFDGRVKTLVFTEKESKIEGNTHYIKSDLKVASILSHLYQERIMSVIIEGGKEVLTSFITDNSWDEARLLVGDMFFYKGLKSPDISGQLVEKKEIKNNTIKWIKNNL